MRPCGARSIRKSPLFSTDARAEDMGVAIDPCLLLGSGIEAIALSGGASHQARKPFRNLNDARTDGVVCAPLIIAPKAGACSSLGQHQLRQRIARKLALELKNKKRTKLRPLYSSIDIQNHRAMVVDRLDAQECRNRVSACRSKVSSRREVAYSTINGSGRVI